MGSVRSRLASPYDIMQHRMADWVQSREGQALFDRASLNWRPIDQDLPHQELTAGRLQFGREKGLQLWVSWGSLAVTLTRLTV